MGYGGAAACYLFGGFVALGGFIGWKKARSKPSLIAGSSFGGLLGLSGALIQGGHEVGGHRAALVLSLILFEFMWGRCQTTGAIMPAGVTGVLAGLSAVFHAIRCDAVHKVEDTCHA
eukprot:Hpha_TRINITY_DN16877_c2_g2::TRINITY_DN16877_c2_g2_i1::g.153215::m.153215